MDYNPDLELITTDELIQELYARNEGAQRDQFENTMSQASAHIQKLKLAFSLRDGGLSYRTVDNT